MKWDHNLLKRFNATGHFRLLGQVKSELVAQPMVREHTIRQSINRGKTTQ